MNEPNNPSDSTPPPPPPPPFTPPPSTETPQPPPPPAATSPASPTSPPASTPTPTAPPKPPVYTPPSGEPPRKSPMPWILGGCGCLALIAIVLTIVGVVLYRAKQKVVEFKEDFRSSLRKIDENQPSPSVSPRSSITPSFTSSPRSRADTTAPKFGWNTYTNEKDKLPANLQSQFVAFSFDYPKSFVVQPQSKMNFVKVEKAASVGKDATAENFAVGYASFSPPDAESGPLYEQLLDDLGKQIARVFHNYKELTRIDESVAGVKSRATLFQADFNDPGNTQLYGKTIVVHPPGKEKGVTILLLGTSLSRDIKRADDLGTKGDTADILRSFKFL